MIEVRDNATANRYEAVDGERQAGFADYIRTAELIVFTHTEVARDYEGRGVGSALARHALEAATEAGLKVVALCPFIAAWMARHPEYVSLEYRATSKVTD